MASHPPVTPNAAQSAAPTDGGSSAVVVSAAIMALALLGDSLLYVVLPLYAHEFGIGLAWVGVLLSANRLIRVVAYGGVVALGERIGPRRLTLVAGSWRPARRSSTRSVTVAPFCSRPASSGAWPSRR